MSVNCYNPKETTEVASRAGVYKANTRWDKVFLSSVNAGFLLSFACASALSTNAAPWFQQNAPGLIRTIAALIFPWGLTAIVMTGSDLCTGSFMFTTLAALQRRISPLKMLMHWFITFWGNLAGSLFIVAIISGYGGVFDAAAYKTEAQTFAVTKQVTAHWHQIFLRGIGANWLVCLACFLGMSGRDFASKLMGIWFPTFAFVSLGLDHVVANMFFIPTGIWQGANGITVGLYIWKGIIPALLGNIIGGGLFVASVYWYLHLQGEPPVMIDGVEYGAPPVGQATLPIIGRSRQHSREPDLESGEGRKRSEV
ncbi:putative formate/nitrite transporter [Lophiostoma macrostomum CBS 122681]|uniref:Putative formate/nitrite transporter n=1 Tax=Lophiostoma macrostomum CBS 122681 TaxID=1314788 RepID=A0A6A6TMM8_9PLEO|nr:putative formate/nitrite transporter [Lophiostoma macrostomum CBS 122681]